MIGLMETLIANILGAMRREYMGGREFFVVPVSFLVHGVLNGSRGALYYPDHEIGKYPGLWNFIPLTNGHTPVSARSPKVFEQYGLGYVFDDSIVNGGGQRRGEAWFDILRTQELAPRVYAKLLAGEKIEVSTGLYTENEPAQGTFNGKPYDGIARNYRPDHLAVLLDQPGACSLQDGCGVYNSDATMCPKCKAKKDKDHKCTPTPEVKNVNKEQLVAWLTTNCDCWKGSGDAAVLSTMNEDKLKLLKTAAEREAEREAVTNAVRRSYGLSDSVTLAGLAQHVTQNAAVQPAPAATAPAPQQAQQQTVTLTPAQMHLLSNAERIVGKEKTLLVNKLTGHITDAGLKQQYTAFLMSKDVVELETLNNLYPVQPQVALPGTGHVPYPQPLPPVYLGAAGGAPVMNNTILNGQPNGPIDPMSAGDENDTLVMPTYNWRQMSEENSKRKVS